MSNSVLSLSMKSYSKTLSWFINYSKLVVGDDDFDMILISFSISVVFLGESCLEVTFEHGMISVWFKLVWAPELEKKNL